MGMIQRDDMGWEVGGGRGGSGLGTHVHPWLIHVNVWQNQYSIVKQNKAKIKKKKGFGILNTCYVELLEFSTMAYLCTKQLSLCNCTSKKLTEMKGEI